MKTFLLIVGFIGVHIFSSAQDISAQLRSIEQKLSSGQESVTQILTDPSYMQLHSKTEFRELIKRFAKQEKITLVTATEPGTRITVKGKIVDKNNKPLSDVLVYVYHTDNKGWYSDTQDMFQEWEVTEGMHDCSVILKRIMTAHLNFTPFIRKVIPIVICLSIFISRYFQTQDRL